jgi:antitoxin MazE
MGVPCVYTLYLQGWRAVKTQVAKWGNSMAVRIPKNVAEAARLRLGDNLELSVEGSGTVKIRKKKGTSKLRDLLREITTANLHTEADWGAPEGKELW